MDLSLFQETPLGPWDQSVVVCELQEETVVSHSPTITSFTAPYSFSCHDIHLIDDSELEAAAESLKFLFLLISAAENTNRRFQRLQSS